IDWIGHTEYSETRIEQLDHIFNLIGITPVNWRASSGIAMTIMCPIKVAHHLPRHLATYTH
ncbi:hypothetical protein ACV1C5_06165, partial [Aeromonas caviae]